MRISDALKEVKDLKVDFGAGGVLTIIYRPPSWTPAEMDALSKDKDIKKIVDQVRKLVVQWDLTDDYNALIPLEEPKPITVTSEDGTALENVSADVPYDPLMHVPISIYMKIIQSINADGKPDPQA